MPMSDVLVCPFCGRVGGCEGEECNHPCGYTASVVSVVMFSHGEGKGSVESLMALQGTHTHTYMHPNMHPELVVREQAMCLFGFVCLCLFLFSLTGPM